MTSFSVKVALSSHSASTRPTPRSSPPVPTPFLRQQGMRCLALGQRRRQHTGQEARLLHVLAPGDVVGQEVRGHVVVAEERGQALERIGSLGRRLDARRLVEPDREEGVRLVLQLQLQGLAHQQPLEDAKGQLQHVVAECDNRALCSLLEQTRHGPQALGQRVRSRRRCCLLCRVALALLDALDQHRHQTRRTAAMAGCASSAGGRSSRQVWAASKASPTGSDSTTCLSASTNSKPSASTPSRTRVSKGSSWPSSCTYESE